MTPEDAQRFWEDLRRAVAQVHVLRQPPTWRRRRTGEMRVTLTEKRAMQAFHLLNGETYTALGKRFRRDRHRIGGWIWTPEYREFYRYYWNSEYQHGQHRGRRPKIARPDEARSAA